MFEKNERRKNRSGYTQGTDPMQSTATPPSEVDVKEMLPLDCPLSSDPNVSMGVLKLTE